MVACFKSGLKKPAPLAKSRLSQGRIEKHCRLNRPTVSAKHFRVDMLLNVSCRNCKCTAIAFGNSMCSVMLAAATNSICRSTQQHLRHQVCSINYSSSAGSRVAASCSWTFKSGTKVCSSYQQQLQQDIKWQRQNRQQRPTAITAPGMQQQRQQKYKRTRHSICNNTSQSFWQANASSCKQQHIQEQTTGHTASVCSSSDTSHTGQEWQQHMQC